VRVQREVSTFLHDVFNAADNLRGERCKLLIGGAGDLGVGVTFSEVRHIVLDLTPSFFNVLQQMGRGERLCKHARLAPEERTLDFHVPVPVLTTGWGDGGVDGTTGLEVAQRTYPGGLGAARVTVNDYVRRLKVGTGRETIHAPLHVPVHAFESLVDLQRSRVQFLSGIQTFAAVAMDTEYYERMAGWTTPYVDLTTEPQLAARIQSLVRDRVRSAVENETDYADVGRGLLMRESAENARYNQSVLARSGDEREGARTRASEAEQRYRDEVARQEDIATRRDVAAGRREEREERQRQRQQEEAERMDCSRYTLLPNGRLARTDRPDVSVNQDRALEMIMNGARSGDPHCQVLFMAVRMYDDARRL
ncbi:MAG: hypothetical protein VXW74_00295, partial [Candidatus Thermoplasmatota archaeon]|nr:hypothetical protein [Candidatus Thermoplasmatota archaeon]